MKKLLCVALFTLVTVVSFGTIPSARAATLTWTLQNFLFDDGGTATGSFGFDADTNTFSGINISTSVNGLLGSNYSLLSPSGVTSATFFDTITGTPASGESRLLFDLASAMTNAGGTIALNLLAGFFDGEVICPDDFCGTYQTGRILTQGSITAPSAVPIPAALPLLAAGLGAMGFMGWRKRRKAA